MSELNESIMTKFILYRLIKKNIYLLNELYMPTRIWLKLDYSKSKSTKKTYLSSFVTSHIKEIPQVSTLVKELLASSNLYYNTKSLCLHFLCVGCECSVNIWPFPRNS